MTDDDDPPEAPAAAKAATGELVRRARRAGFPATFDYVNHLERIASAAGAYTAARIELAGANKDSWIHAAMNVDTSWHRLLLATGQPCECEEGTCPGD